MNIETAYYIIHHFPRLLTAMEHAAIRHYNTTSKIGAAEKYHSVETYNEKIKWHKEHNNLTDDPSILKLLENGIQALYIMAATRIKEEAPDKIYFNNCPECDQLARTPYARQCKYCGHSWHDTIAAQFKATNVFSLTQRPNTLFYSGNIISGTIKIGMKLDLTFHAVAIKPKITAIEHLDFMAEKKAELALGVIIEKSKEVEYLKRQGVLAIPIIIEK